MRKHGSRAWLGAVLVLFILTGVFAPATTRADTLNPAPDLIIETVTWSPAIPTIGNTVTFTVTIQNQGTGQAGSSYVACYVDDVYQTSASVDPIGPGATAAQTFTWKALSGSHVIKAVADCNNNVAESDEANNDKAFAFSVLAPDLIIEAITWSPISPSIGDEVDFTVTMKNRGSSRAGACNLEFFIDNSSRGYRSVLGIEAGATATETFTWTAQPGAHQVKAVDDVLNQVSESDETNNSKTVTYETAAPDLVADITWLPASPAEGDNVTFSVTVTNQGSGKGGSSTLAWFIDNTLQDSAFFGPMDIGATANQTFFWTAQAGPHTFRAVADANSDVIESDETNNEKLVTLPIGAPDLIVQAIAWSPETATIGEQVVINVTIANQGKSRAGNSTVYLYIDGGSRLQQDIYEIDAGTAVTISFPWTGQSGSHSIKAVADGADRIAESNEANNTKTATINPSPLALPDLIVQDIVWTPNNPALGDTVTFSVTIMNQGTGHAGACYVAYYVDSSWLTSAYVNEMDPGSTTTMTFPWVAQAGSHVVKVAVDTDHVIKETSETNNEKSVTLSVLAPDLVIQDITFSPVTPLPGDTVTFNVTIKNQGDIGANRSYVQFYLDGSSMGYNDVPELDAGAAVTRSFTWTAQAGSHLVKAIVDMENQVAESNESNNVKTAGLPAPDLVIDSITWSPVNPSENDTVTFYVTIKNLTGSTAGPSSVYLDIDGASQGQADTPEIAAGAAATENFTWVASVGSHTIKAIADGSNQVFESNETNNEQAVNLSVSLLPVATPSPPPPQPSGTGQPGVSAPPGSQSSNVSAVQNKVSNLAQKSSPAPASGKETWLVWWYILAAVVLVGAVAVAMLRSRQQPR